MGGDGVRFGGELPKQFCVYKKKLLFEYTTEAFLNSGLVSNVLFVFPEKYLEETCCNEALENLKKQYKNISFFKVSGGKDRHESLENAIFFLENQKEKNKTLLIHDANRPYLSKKFLLSLKRIKNKFRSQVEIKIYTQ